MRFTWEVVQQEGADVVVRYRRVWLKGDAMRPVQPADKDVICFLSVDSANSKRNDIASSIDVESTSAKSVDIFGSFEINASLGSMDIEGSLEVVNFDGRAQVGCVLEVRGLVTIVEKMGKDYMVKGRINPTATDDVIKATIDLMVKNDYMKHRLVGMRGELSDA